MNYIYRLKRGTTEQWAARNPILLSGEEGLDTDTGTIRIGNGVDHYLDLKLEYWPIDKIRTLLQTGGGSALGFEFVQTTPASTWIINVPNSFGRRPDVTIYVGDQIVSADVESSETTVTITFPAPYSGSAVLT